MISSSQDQRDRAHEWTNERRPEVEGPAWEAAYLAALADIVAIDRAADVADRCEPAASATARHRQVIDGSGALVGWVVS